MAVTSEASRERVHERVPEARVAVTDFADRGPPMGEDVGRLLMVDRETVLLSARRDGLVPTDLAETGLWGPSVGHGLVAWIRELLDARRRNVDFVTAAE